MEQRIRRLGFSNNNKFISYGCDAVVGYVPKTIKEKYNTLYENSKNNRLQPNTKIYLSPLNEFPSYKLKNYLEENNIDIKLTRKLNEIDSIVINHNYITKHYIKKNLCKFYIIPLESFETPDFISYFDTTSAWYDARKWNQHNNKSANVTHFYIEEEEYKKILAYDSKFSFIGDLPSDEGFILTSSLSTKKVQTNFHNFIKLFDIIDQYGVNVIYDHNISQEVNKDLSMDDDMFETLLGMFFSKDESNHTIAQEILTNVDFESSKPYLIYLNNMFYLLSKSSSQKSFSYLQRQLQPYQYIYLNKNQEPQFNLLLPRLINNLPEYSQEFMNCFKIHLNTLLTTASITEIKIR